jgi:hypothetical protein
MLAGRSALLAAVAVLSLGLGPAHGGAGGISVSRQREEVACADDSPMHVAHLSERLVVASSDTVYIDGELLTRGEDYWLDYAEGIVYIKDGAMPGQCVRILYSVFPLRLKPSYSLRAIDRERRSQIVKPESKFAVKEEPRDYDLTASGFKTLSLETSAFRDVRVNQSLSLNIGGKIGDAVEIRGVLSDGDASFGEMTSTTKLKDLDRIFMEVRSERAFARVGDIEIVEAPGELLRLRRNMTGFLAQGSHGSKGLTLSGASSRSRYESFEVEGREGISGPYVVLDPDGQRAGIAKGSDRIWVDGQPMARGANADYTIDYSMSEIYFSPRHMIRDGARIIVDYEAIRYEDNRQFYFGKSSIDVGRGTSVAVSFVNEGYSQASSSSPLDDDSGRTILGAGDGEWVDGGQYVGSGQGGYIKIDLDSVSYYEFVGVGSGDYEVKFTRVADGEGAYSYTLSEIWGTYIYLYTGTGDYVAMVKASPRLTSRVFHMNASSKPVDWLEVTSEAAQSKGHCRNPGGRWDLKEDKAYTVGLRASSAVPDMAGLGPGSISLSAKRRSVGDHYIGFDRLRRPDFLEVWAQDPAAGFEESDEIGLEYSAGDNVQTSFELGTLETPAGRSDRYRAGLNLGTERLGITANSEMARMPSESARRESGRNGIAVRVPVGFLQLGAGRRFETRSRLRDSTSVRRTEYYSAVSVSGRYGKMNLTVSAGSEDRDQGMGWGDYASIREGRLEFESNRGRTFSVIGALSQRETDYSPAIALSDQRTTGAELHMNLREVLAVSSMTLDYRLANTMTAVYGSELVKVDYGGDYDSLGNYRPGSGGYALSRYEKGKEPVTRVRANFVVELGRRGKVILDRSLSARTGLDVEGETCTDQMGRVALLSPGHMLDGPEVRYGRVNLVQEVVYRRSQAITMSMTARGQRTLDARCSDRSEIRTTAEISTKVLSSGFRGISLDVEGRVARTRSLIQMATGEISPDQQTWLARLNVQRNVRSNLRSKIRFELLGQERTEPVSSSLEAKVAPGFTLFAGPLRCDCDLGVRKMIRSASSALSLTPTGDSVDWDSRVNMRQGRYTSLSFQYSGRKIEGLPVVHNLRASLTASF